MKKFIALGIVALTLLMSACSDKPVAPTQLPVTAQTFLKQHFGNKVPLIVTADWDDYKIVYETGEAIEFDHGGNWKDIECYASKVPNAAVPAQITTYINQNYPGKSVVKLERHRSVYEVKLNNGMEVEFNRNFQVIGMDYDD